MAHQWSRRQVLGAGAAAPYLRSAPAARPNIVLFLTDQQRQDSLGCYGNPLVKTPHLDRLAAGGARFTSAYCATPLCSPARASIYSGVYPSRHGVVDLWGKIPSALGPVPGWPDPSPRELPWMGEIFQSAGYETVFCGKWHCLTGARRPGFQEVLSLYGDPDDVESPEQDDFAAYARAAGYEVRGHGHSMAHERGPGYGTSIFRADDHPDTYLVRRTCEYLSRKPRRPFLLVVSINSPHSPYVPPAPYDTRYNPEDVVLPPNVNVFANPRRPVPLRGHPRGLIRARERTLGQLREMWAHYYGMIAHIDDLVGRMMAALDGGGLRRNTLVAITTDHGDTLGCHRLQDKGPFLYDTVARVPLLLHAPDLFPARVIDAPVSHVSLLPTLLDLAGIPDPARRDGLSLKPALEGKALAGEPVFCEYNRFYGEHFPVRGIVTPAHKYVHYFGPEGELFDRLEDPFEMVNLLHDPGCRETLQSLRGRLFRRMLAGGDRFASLLTAEERALAGGAYGQR